MCILSCVSHVYTAVVVVAMLQVGTFGIVVTFYNNVHGLVPAKILAKQGVENVADAYSMGQVSYLHYSITL